MGGCGSRRLSRGPSLPGVAPLPPALPLRPPAPTRLGPARALRCDALPGALRVRRRHEPVVPRPGPSPGRPGEAGEGPRAGSSRHSKTDPQCTGASRPTAPAPAASAATASAPAASSRDTQRALPWPAGASAAWCSRRFSCMRLAAVRPFGSARSSSRHAAAASLPRAAATCSSPSPVAGSRSPSSPSLPPPRPPPPPLPWGGSPPDQGAGPAGRGAGPSRHWHGCVGMY